MVKFNPKVQAVIDRIDKQPKTEWTPELVEFYERTSIKIRIHFFYSNSSEVYYCSEVKDKWMDKKWRNRNGFLTISVSSIFFTDIVHKFIRFDQIKKIEIIK